MLLTLLLSAVMAGPVLAQEKPAEAPAAKAPQAEAPANPHIQDMNAKARDLAATLTTEEIETLGLVRNNFEIINSIDYALEKVGQAVKLCADKNPELKDDIKKEHASFDGAIDESLKKQQETLKQAVSTKNFEKPGKVQDYFDTIDKAAKFADVQLEKVVVTTPEACKALAGSMADNKKIMLDHLANLEWPESKAAPAGGKDAAP